VASLVDWQGAVWCVGVQWPWLHRSVGSLLAIRRLDGHRDLNPSHAERLALWHKVHAQVRLAPREREHRHSIGIGRHKTL
jgi:hypothetical protein